LAERITEDGTTELDFGFTANPDFNIQKPKSFNAKRIDGNDTVQTIAARELGNPDRFKEIVVLNNLKPPYIDPAGGANVLKPGDKIKLPSQGPVNRPSGTKENIQYNITKFLSQSERNLGVDLRLTGTNDLAVSNTGDLDMLAGIENMSQAILLKLGLENGSLKRHSEIGAGLKVGVKAIATRLEGIRELIIDSMLNDGRIESIPFLQLRQEGGTTFIDMVVRLKNINQPVPIPLVL